jgi:hypothetical protein
LPNGKGKWWVQSPPFDLSLYMHGPYSATMNFSLGITAQPNAISPVSVTTTSSPTFRWQPIPGRNHRYYLFVTDSTTTGRVQVNLTEAAAGCINGSGTCTYTPGVALASGPAKWWVQANSPDGRWSTQSNFTVAP